MARVRKFPACPQSTMYSLLHVFAPSLLQRSISSGPRVLAPCTVCNRPPSVTVNLNGIPLGLTPLMNSRFPLANVTEVVVSSPPVVTPTFHDVELVLVSFSVIGVTVPLPTAVVCSMPPSVTSTCQRWPLLSCKMPKAAGDSAGPGNGGWGPNPTSTST